MKKRILLNIILAFILATIIQIARDFVKMEILEDHSSFSGTWWEYVKLQPIVTFLFLPLIFLVFVLVPYNIILVKFELKSLNYFKKAFIFLIVMTTALCIAGTFANVWMYPYWKNVYYLFYFVPYSFLFAGLIHLLADRKSSGTAK